MNASKYSTLDDDWEVLDGGVLISPLVKERPEQTLIFAERIRNGSISADITLLDAQTVRSGEKAMEACLIARYAGPEGAYYAGTGAFDAKFFIGKVLPGPFYQGRQFVGRRSSALPNKTYRLRLEFNGSQITLYENDVQQLVLYDESYLIGQCGLKTWKTRARFDNVCIVPATPKAFVIMPFATELDFVHRVIEQTVESYGIECTRADQIAVSRPVMEDVKGQIAGADLVIVDFTGKNPNVYYEAGLADAWKKDWIVVVQSSDDMTFDVRHIRSIRYTNTMGADHKLADDLRAALEALGYSRRPRDGRKLTSERGEHDSNGQNQGIGTEADTDAGRRGDSRHDHRRGARRNRKPPAA